VVRTPGLAPGTGCLLDGQLGQRERLQPLVGNGSTAQDRETIGARRQAGLRSLQGDPPVTQPATLLMQQGSGPRLSTRAPHQRHGQHMERVGAAIGRCRPAARSRRQASHRRRESAHRIMPRHPPWGEPLEALGSAASFGWPGGPPRTADGHQAWRERLPRPRGRCPAARSAQDRGQLAVQGGPGELAELVGGEGAVGADEVGVGEADRAPAAGGGGVGVDADGPGGVVAAVEADEGGGWGRVAGRLRSSRAAPAGRITATTTSTATIRGRPAGGRRVSSRPRVRRGGWGAGVGSAGVGRGAGSASTSPA
jgi:hypothetical protein